MINRQVRWFEKAARKESESSCRNRILQLKKPAKWWAFTFCQLAVQGIFDNLCGFNPKKDFRQGEHMKNT